LRDLEHEFANELAVIGVHTPKFPAEKVPENVAHACARLGIDHPVVSDPDFAVWQAYGIRAWPTLVFIDPLGRVVANHPGEFVYQAVRDYLAALLDDFRQQGRIDPTPVPHQSSPSPDTFLRYPGKVLADGETGRLFIADSGNRRIVLADFDGSNVEEITGGSDPFRNPQGLALSPDRATIYVADPGKHQIRRVELETSRVDTIAGTGRRGFRATGGYGPDIDLASSWDLHWHDGRLWIAMAGTHQIWALDPETLQIEVTAGTGVESIHDGLFDEATFSQPMGITGLDRRIFTADSESSAIRSLDLETRRVRRLVGRGLFYFGDLDARGDSVRLQHPQGVAATAEGDQIAIYFVDTYNNKIKRLDPSTREVRTVAGSGGHGFADGPAESAEFWEPAGLSITGRTAFLADTNNHQIRRLDLDTGVVTTGDIQRNG
jgi:DNA-binding beta-propeller fold protein YncE